MQDKYEVKLKKQPDFTIDELSRIPFLNDLSDDHLEVLGTILNKKYFKQDSYIFKEGEAYSSVYFIIRGSVKILKKVPEQKKLKLLAHISAPQLLGEQALICHGTRSASAYVTEQMVAAELTYHDFEYLIETYPRLAVNVMQKIANIISVRLKVLNTKYAKEGEQIDSL